jgi:DNA-binding NtrC family response regulator
MSSRLAEGADFPAAPYSLLLLVGAVEDNDAVFSQFPWHIRRARCFREARAAMCRDLARVVLCEHALEDASWKDVLGLASSRRYPPPVIVTSRLADERLWAEVLNLGGYDVLPQPLDRNEAVRAIGLAWDRWACQEGLAQPADLALTHAQSALR